MNRTAYVFLAAIFLPSLGLGWLALRAAGEQGVLIERQAADLHQAETDAIAGGIRARAEETQAAFIEAVRTLVADRGPAALAEDFGPALADVWTGGGVPFAINPDGRIAYPSQAEARGSGALSSFLQDNAAFLSNRASAEVYAQQQAPAPMRGAETLLKKSRVEAKDKASQVVASRNIQPQKQAADSKESTSSKLAVEVSDFQTVVGNSAQGALGRFVQNELQVLFWTRPDPTNNWLFGLMMGPQELDAFARGILPTAPAQGTQLAILNEKARPVARSPEGFSANWNRPFVGSEIGEILPHWEVALYLSDPGALRDSARLVSVTLILLIALALAAILAGGYLVALDTRRQLALAQKKTDFVSNVSHELKTPLTSIRMFAELLAGDRVEDPGKRTRYLRIIAAESERLTRLVNNVLDFSRMERGRKNQETVELDALPVIARVWEAESLRLRDAGFETAWQSDAGPCRVHSAGDAIAQVLVNLLSNAEKYHGPRKEILLITQCRNGFLTISVCDRGPGVPKGMESKIFDPFFRADDSLSSEVPGSGLGLTLARRAAREVGGDVTFESREGGGSIFTLHIPLIP